MSKIAPKKINLIRYTIKAIDSDYKLLVQDMSLDNAYDLNDALNLFMAYINAYVVEIKHKIVDGVIMTDYNYPIISLKTIRRQGYFLYGTRLIILTIEHEQLNDDSILQDFEGGEYYER